MRWLRIPADGIGLAHMEFVFSNHVKVHPMVLMHCDAVTDAVARMAIDELTEGYHDLTEYFVETPARGFSRITAVEGKG